MIAKNTRVCVGLLIAVLLALSGCGGDGKSNKTDAAKKTTLVIAQVRVDRNAIDPAKKETAAIRFMLNETADVTLSIFDGRDRQVFTNTAEDLAPGEHSLAWPGTDSRGEPVPPEAYSYTLRAKNAGGEVVYDLTDVTAGEPLTAKDVRWDAKAKAVTYYLDKPARVNLRLGLQDGPYLRTLVDWVPRTAGAHAEAWDGADASGVLQLQDHPLLSPVVKATSLPANTLFVGPLPDRVRFVAEAGQAPQRARTVPMPRKRLFDRARQPLETRGDITASLTLAGDYRKDSQGRWIVSGQVPLVINVSDGERQRVLQRRFESVFYIDGTYAHENELGYLPLTWVWDTSRINPGEHFVTLNVRGYEGNFGAATLKVIVADSAAHTPDAAKAGTR